MGRRRRRYHKGANMKSTDQVGITFVNAVTGRGIMNGVVNIQFGALTFDITEDDKVSPELVIACRLRMDRVCAKQLRDNLSELLSMIDRTELEAMVAAMENGKDQTEGTLN